MSHECPTCGGPVVPHTDKEGKTRYRRALVEQGLDSGYLASVNPPTGEVRGQRIRDLYSRGPRIAPLRILDP